jgi:hypothetical protein
MQKTITVVTIALFSLLVIFSLVLSFNGLQQTALNNGKADWQSVFWPFLIDGGLVIFSLAVVYKSLRNEPTRLQWCMVVLFTIATVAFNIFQDAHPTVQLFVLGSAPVVLFLTFETLMGMVRAGVQRDQYYQNLDTLKAEKATKEAKIATLDSKIVQLQSKIDTLESTVVQLELTPRQHRLLDLWTNGETNKTTLAKQLEVSRSTLYNDMQTLEQAGMLHPADVPDTVGRNGQQS